MGHGASERGLVSVVITCYNQARYLSEAIESVLAQTYRPVELVVIDDGSRDRTPEVLRGYPQARCFHLLNAGVARARNRGLKESRGRSVVFLDGDDRLLPTALETQLEALESDPAAAFVAGRHSFIAADGSPLDWPTDPVVHGDQYRELLLNNFITMPAMVLHRRESLDAAAPGGFSTEANHSSDYELYLRVARQKPVVRHDRVVAQYRVHDANTSHKATMMLRGTMAVYRSQWKYVKGNKDYEEAYRKGALKWQERYGGEVVSLIRVHLEQGSWDDRWRAFRGLLSLLRYSPRVLRRHAWQKIRNTARRLTHSA